MYPHAAQLNLKESAYKTDISLKSVSKKPNCSGCNRCGRDHRGCNRYGCSRCDCDRAYLERKRRHLVRAGVACGPWMRTINALCAG